MSNQANETVRGNEANGTPDTSPEPTTENTVTAAEIQVKPENGGENRELDIDALYTRLQKETERAQANYDLALRTQAEMDNLRKRTNRDIESAHKYALEKFVDELLPVLDSMKLGISAAENTESIDDLKEGMGLTVKMFINTLEKFSVRTIDPEGEKFNPGQHEAISMKEIEGTEAGMVVTVVQTGYELNGRLLRPAMVIVSK